MSDEWANVVSREFVRYARQKLDQHHRQIVRCARLLDQEQLWWRANAHCNSVGNLILHLNGNVRQWLLGGLGGEVVERDRPAEFAARGGMSADDLLWLLGETLRAVDRLFNEMDGRVLAARFTIQGYTVSGVMAVFHVVEHFAGHTGQIVHIVKTLRGEDLSMYDAQGRRVEGERELP